MYVEMIIAEMRDRESVIAYETLFIREIGPMLAALPGVEAAYMAAKKRSCFAIVTVVWHSRQIAEAWRREQGHRALLDSLNPYACSVASEFFALDERSHPQRHALN
jgi:hypothetical protein